MKYIAPTTIEELQYFQKLDVQVEGEIWKHVLVDELDNFKVSNYGRFFNVDTNRLRKSTYAWYGDVYNVMYNVIIYYKKGKKKNITLPVYDIILHSFYPSISNTHINPIFIDDNIFNLSLDNIKYVPNTYFKDDIKDKERHIYINKEKTKYTIDVNGIITNLRTNKELHKETFFIIRYYIYFP